MKRKTLVLIFSLSIIVAIVENNLQAQLPDSTRIQQLEQQVDLQSDEIDRLRNRLDKVENDIEDRASTGLVLFLFGIFCALWAQNSGRNPWLWFFLGAIFNFITVLVLLSKNSHDKKLAVNRQSPE